MRNSRDEGVGKEAVPEDQRSDLLPFSLREPDNVWKHRSTLFGSRSMSNVIHHGPTLLGQFQHSCLYRFTEPGCSHIPALQGCKCQRWDWGVVFIVVLSWDVWNSGILTGRLLRAGSCWVIGKRVDERPLSHLSYHARDCYENK